MIALLVALSLAQTPRTHAKPGQSAPYSVQIQGSADGTPIPISGSISTAGAADTVGSAATFDSNSDCAFVATAGQTGAGFILQAGTLAATLTPSVSVDSTNGTNGTWVASGFVDVDGNTASTLVVTNPNSATARGIKLMSGTRYARVCTTAFTSGTTTGNLMATTPEPPPPAAGADVTDRAARLLGVISAGNNNIGDVDVASSALPTGASTAAKQPALGTAGAASADVITIQGVASMTPLQVADNGGSLTVDGTVTVTDGAGALNVIVDSGAITATVTDGAGALNVIVDSITAGNNNIGDVDVASLPNEGQQTAANSISVTPDTDNDSIGAAAAAVPGEYTVIAGTDGTNTTPIYIDPCQREAKTVYVVNISTATTTEIANQVAAEFFYVCSINLVAAGADNVAIVEDDTDACASPTAGLNGGTTAASGWNFAANGGIALGNGESTVMKTATANRYFCIITSAAVQLSGTITYVSAP